MKIVTHNGPFHADDVFCVAAMMLVQSHPVPVVIRTRDESIINEADIVFDVGGEYDEIDGGRFDHHQFSLEDRPCRSNGVPYASFGLLMHHNGWAADIIGAACGGMLSFETSLLAIRDRLDEELIMGVDAADLGYTDPALKGLERRFFPMTVSRMVSGFNPNWTDKPDFDGQFIKAVDWAKTHLVNHIRNIAAEMLAEGFILKAPTELDGRVLMLDRFMPWAEHVTKRDQQDQLLYTVFPNPEGTWMVQQVPEKPNSFKGRKPLPESWAAKRGGDLQVITQVSDAVFCHGGRFIAGAESKEGALQLAQLAINS